VLSDCACSCLNEQSWRTFVRAHARALNTCTCKCMFVFSFLACAEERIVRKRLTNRCASRQDGKTVGPFTISGLRPGSAAEQTGLFRVGDLVHAVDGKSIEHLSPTHVSLSLSLLLCHCICASVSLCLCLRASASFVHFSTSLHAKFLSEKRTTCLLVSLVKCGW
jgi:hypothetical protein